MKFYVDTSVLFSLYVADANSPKADAWRKQNPEALPLTMFHRLELRNALSLAEFQKRLTTAQLQATWQNIETDIAAGILIPKGGLWHRVLSEAEKLAANQTPQLGTRTLDLIHVAAAKTLGIQTFCSADTRQISLASAIGLTVESI